MSTMHTVRSASRPFGRGVAATLVALVGTLLPMAAFASELDLKLPTLDPTQRQLLFVGLGCACSAWRSAWSCSSR
jgi:hypothetical protein